MNAESTLYDFVLDRLIVQVTAMDAAYDALFNRAEDADCAPLHDAIDATRCAVVGTAIYLATMRTSYVTPAAGVERDAA